MEKILQTFSELDSILDLSFTVLCIFAGLTWTSLLCYYATMAVHDVKDLGDFVYATNWHKYPPQFRKYFVLIIAQSQRQGYFTGYKLIRCSLEMCSRVNLFFCFFSDFEFGSKIIFFLYLFSWIEQQLLTTLCSAIYQCNKWNVLFQSFVFFLVKTLMIECELFIGSVGVCAVLWLNYSIEILILSQKCSAFTSHTNFLFSAFSLFTFLYDKKNWIFKWNSLFIQWQIQKLVYFNKS